MKGIKLCAECADYNWKKHKCNRGSSIETNARDPFYDDCPLPEVVEVVRCKDCKWYLSGIDNVGQQFSRCNNVENIRVYGQTTPNWFCADGKRK